MPTFIEVPVIDHSNIDVVTGQPRKYVISVNPDNVEYLTQVTTPSPYFYLTSGKSFQFDSEAGDVAQVFGLGT